MPSVMPISNWDRLDGLPEKITADEFRRQHAAEINLTLEEYDCYLVVEPCDDYVGWAAVPKTLVRREMRERRAREIAQQKAEAQQVGEFVYFARLGDLIKIGYSTNPVRRAEELNAELLGFVPGDRELEASLHYELREYRERFEWYRRDRHVQLVVNKVLRQK